MRDPSFAAAQRTARADFPGCELAPQESERMGTQREAMRAIIFDDLAPACHGGKRDFFLDLLRYDLLRALLRRFEERQGFVPQPFDGPGSLPT